MEPVIVASTLLPVNRTLGVVLVVLLLVAAGAAALAHLGEGRYGYAGAVLTAGLRAAVQLAAVASVIRYAADSPPLLFAFLLVMYAERKSVV